MQNARNSKISNQQIEQICFMVAHSSPRGVPARQHPLATLCLRFRAKL